MSAPVTKWNQVESGQGGSDYTTSATSACGLLRKCLEALMGDTHCRWLKLMMGYWRWAQYYVCASLKVIFSWLLMGDLYNSRLFP